MVLHPRTAVRFTALAESDGIVPRNSATPSITLNSMSLGSDGFGIRLKLPEFRSRVCGRSAFNWGPILGETPVLRSLHGQPSKSRRARSATPFSPNRGAENVAVSAAYGIEMGGTSSFLHFFILHDEAEAEWC